MRSITSVGATEVRKDLLEEVVHSAYWNSSILVWMGHELLPSLLYCLLLCFSPWRNGTLSQVGFYLFSVFDNPNIVCSSGRQSQWVPCQSTGPGFQSFERPISLQIFIHSSCWLDTIIVRISGCYHKVYMPKVESNVFPSLKPSALLDSSFLLLAALSSQMLGLKTLATLLMPASLYFKY